MNRIKIIKKGKVNAKDESVSTKISVSKTHTPETREIVENWVSDWRGRREHERRLSLNKLQLIKSDGVS